MGSMLWTAPGLDLAGGGSVLSARCVPGRAPDPECELPAGAAGGSLRRVPIEYVLADLSARWNHRRMSHVYPPAERPEVQLLVEGTWHYGELRMWKRRDVVNELPDRYEQHAATLSVGSPTGSTRTPSARSCRSCTSRIRRAMRPARRRARSGPPSSKSSLTSWVCFSQRNRRTKPTAHARHHSSDRAPVKDLVAA